MFEFSQEFVPLCPFSADFLAFEGRNDFEKVLQILKANGGFRALSLALFSCRETSCYPSSFPIS